MYRQQHPVPPITPQLRKAARERPGGYVYVPDPMFRPQDEVPPYGIKGCWQVGRRGELVQFIPNPHYRPSPVELGFPAATDELDLALQLLATGYLAKEDFAARLVGERVHVPVTASGALMVPVDGGAPLLSVYSSHHHLPPGRCRSARWQVAELLTLPPPGCDIAVNPHSPHAARIPVLLLLAAARARGTPAAFPAATAPVIPRTLAPAPVRARSGGGPHPTAGPLLPGPPRPGPLSSRW